MSSRVQEFKREAEAFFMVRRTKHRKRGARMRPNAKTFGNWRLLGSGLYGEAWEHGMWPGFVLKISGPEEWGYAAGLGPTACPTEDLWPAYAEFCMRKRGKHLPHVHHVQRTAGMLTWAIMKKYHDGTGVSIPSWVRDTLNGYDAPPSGNRWLLKLNKLKHELGARVDLHCGNIMQDPHTLDWVITDPFSSVNFDF